MNKKISILAILFVVILLSSCKSTRQLETREKATSFKHLVTLIQEVEPSFKDMNASSISMNIKTDEQQMNVSAGLRMITDSVIVLSIYPFMGIELYSVELYRDKWILYDKLNQRYVTDSYDYLSQLFGVEADFNTFQSLFSARLFSIGQKEFDMSKCNYKPLEGGKNEITYESKHTKQTTLINDTHTIEKITLQSKKDNYSLTAQYNEYVINRGINYPRNIKLEASSNSKTIANLNLKISKVVFNSDLKISLSNPERYTESSIDQIIK